MTTSPLTNFLASLPGAPDREAFASRCETSLQYLRHIAAGRKRPSVEMCLTLERQSAGVLRCEALRPDVDWDYLANRRVADRQGLEDYRNVGGAGRSAPGRPAANRRGGR